MSFTVFGLSGYPLVAAVSMLVYLAIVWVLWLIVGLRKKTYLLFAVLSVVLGVLCSRLLYCAVTPASFSQFLSADLLSPQGGGLSMMGFLLGILLAIAIAAKINDSLYELPLSVYADVAACPVGLLVFGLRLGEGLTGELGIGRQVDSGFLTEKLPFLFVTEKLGTMELYRLAVFRYEAVFALIIVLLLVLYIYRAIPNRFGDAHKLFILLYCGGQVLFESMRDDGHMVLGFIRVQQVLALLILLALLWVISRWYADADKSHVRNTVTAAWTLLPIALFIVILMVAPINHVLDLTGHIPLGIGLLAGIGLYLAFFLRIKGADPRLIIQWLIAVCAVIGCVLLEFSMDVSTNLPLDFALLALCALVLTLSPYTLYRKLLKPE